MVGLVKVSKRGSIFCNIHSGGMQQNLGRCFVELRLQEPTATKTRLLGLGCLDNHTSHDILVLYAPVHLDESTSHAVARETAKNHYQTCLLMLEAFCIHLFYFQRELFAYLGPQMKRLIFACRSPLLQTHLRYRRSSLTNRNCSLNSTIRI